MIITACVAQLLKAYRIRLASVNSLQRTEGWIAGLHLAALALAHAHDYASFIRGFTGSHRYLMDYVQEDILAHVEKPLQDFLLHCAILPCLSAALSQAVTAQADLHTCQQMLEQLERANLFLVPLDEARHCKRKIQVFYTLIAQGTTLFSKRLNDPDTLAGVIPSR